MEDLKEVGLTKSVGYQFGKRKTFKLSKEEAWEFLFSKEGEAIWLGASSDDLELKVPFHTGEGVEGEIMLIKPFSHARMAWKKKDWKNISIVQVRVIEAKTGSTISFHQEKLESREQREEMKIYWTNVMEKITTTLREKEHKL